MAARQEFWLPLVAVEFHFADAANEEFFVHSLGRHLAIHLGLSYRWCVSPYLTCSTMRQLIVDSTFSCDRVTEGVETGTVGFYYICIVVVRQSSLMTTIGT